MRSRNWSLVVYDIENFDEYIKNRMKLIKHYVAILHDKDDVEPHYHLCVNLSSSYESDYVRNYFKVSDNSNCLAIRTDDKYKSRFYVVDYFLHKKEKNKFQYDESSLYSDDLSYWLYEETNNDSEYIKRKGLIDDFVRFVRADDDCLSIQDLYVKYGRDVIINFEKYRDFAQKIIYDYRKNKY